MTSLAAGIRSEVVCSPQRRVDGIAWDLVTKLRSSNNQRLGIRIFFFIYIYVLLFNLQKHSSFSHLQVGQEQKTENKKCELSLKYICRSNAKSNRPSYLGGGEKNMKNKLLPFCHVCGTLVNRWNEQNLLAKV